MIQALGDQNHRHGCKCLRLCGGMKSSDLLPPFVRTVFRVLFFLSSVFRRGNSVLPTAGPGSTRSRPIRMRQSDRGAALAPVMFGPLRFILFALVSASLHSIGLSSAQQVNKTECTEKIKECERRGQPGSVCGSDGRTYRSRCHLLRTACMKGFEVKVRRKGPCPDTNACWEGLGSNVEGEHYVPQCLPDGRYAPVQCHDATKYCWCVTPQGKLISGTSVRGYRPKCNRKGCGRIERTNFVNNLLRLFQTEYERTLNGSTYNESSAEEMSKLAAQWKFRTLDHNKNDSLSKDEYKSLRRLVRKFVRPKGCARSFTRFCDADKDLEITLLEWTTCLQKRTPKKPLVSRKKKKDPDLYLDRGVPQESVSLVPDSGVEEPAERRDEIEAIDVDCLSDRKSALEEQQENSQRFFVPECSPDGRYMKIQCYNSTGYCWCVDEDSGKPIPGTSVKDPNPQCDAVQPPPRPMKGCPDSKKATFLRDFLKTLNESMFQHYAGEGLQDLPLKGEQSSNEFEKAVNWYFHLIDVNRNKVLERKEWRAVRKLTISTKKLKKCGRKLPRYCDVNQDRKISYTEWLNCLYSNTSTTSSTKPGSVSRRGPNPLESVLKQD